VVEVVNMTKTKTVRGETEVRADLRKASKAEHRAVEAARNDRPASLARAWAAAERTNVLLRELAALRG
jgi:hypothetical protein